MNTIRIKKISLTLLLIIFGIVAYLSIIDEKAEIYTEQGIKRTLLTYAVSRSLNGVISVAQGTEVAVSPAGVGLTFTPGQILDPINDLIERFSWVVLASGTSLGIQRLFLEITSAPWISGLLVVFSLLSIYFLWNTKSQSAKYQTIRTYTGRILILLLLLRFAIPFVAILNEVLYMSFLKPQYEQAQFVLEKASTDIDLINRQTRQQMEDTEDDASLLDKAEAWLDRTKESFDVDKQMTSLKQAATEMSQQVINMIVVFIVQTLLFPLLFLWILIKVGKVGVSQFRL